jgi:hypothetical protein
MRPTKNGKSRMESQIPDKLLPARIAKWTESRRYKRHTLNDGTSSRAKSRNRTSATANDSLTTYTHTFLELFEFAFGDADRAHKFWSPQLAHTFSGLIEPSSGALLYRAYSSSLNSILEFSSGAMLKLRFGSLLKLTEPSFGALRVHFWGSLHSASLENTEQNLGAHYILRALFHRAYFGFQDTPSSLYKIQFWNSSSSLLV